MDEALFAAAPEDADLRAQVAGPLVGRGRPAEALPQAASGPDVTDARPRPDGSGPGGSRDRGGRRARTGPVEDDDAGSGTTVRLPVAAGIPSG